MPWGPGDGPVEAEEGGDVSADGCGEVTATVFALSQQLDDEDAREMGQGFRSLWQSVASEPGRHHACFMLIGRNGKLMRKPKSEGVRRHHR
jgi:hypothetical protein